MKKLILLIMTIPLFVSFNGQAEEKVEEKVVDKVEERTLEEAEEKFEARAVEPGVLHVVFIWLKEPGNVEHRQQIIEGSKKLADIPGIWEIRAGTALESEREVVDDSFDVALYMRFPTVKAMQDYLVHPEHVEVVQTEFVPIMDYYKVYDFTDE